VKDKRQYEKLRDQGNSKEKSARIANASANSSRRAVAKRGGSSPPYNEWTKSRLYERAREVGISGRSSMSKSELVNALRNH
jgi:hypothetical protein